MLAALTEFNLILKNFLEDAEYVFQISFLRIFFLSFQRLEKQETILTELGVRTEHFMYAARLAKPSSMTR